jgi:hypothetical protein
VVKPSVQSRYPRFLTEEKSLDIFLPLPDKLGARKAGL